MSRTAGSFRLPPQLCPVCGYMADRASPIGRATGAPPEPDDMTLCLQCGAALVFGPRLEFHRANPADLALLERHDPTAYRLLRRGQQAISALPWRPPPRVGGRA